MTDLVECSSSSTPLASATEKPVLVRVKRKASQSPLDALWLEISGRPLKRPLLDLGKLSVSDSSQNEDLRTKKLLVQHVETVDSSEATKEFLQSFMNNADAKELRRKTEERRCIFKQENKQDHLRLAARQKHDDLVKSARFEQIWKSRKRNKQTAHNNFVNEFCHLYDVVRVDVKDKTSSKVEKEESASLEDNAILCNYLPLIREFLPTAAAEIESDLNAYYTEQDGYVYDLYTLGDDVTRMEDDAVMTYPLVQVEDGDDFYDGPEQSEFDTDDSNAEDNPLNDYPDEESSDNEEHDGRSSYDQSEEDVYEDEVVDENNEDYWKWEYR